MDVVLSHTTPLKYEPVEVFLKGIDQSEVGKPTGGWMELKAGWIMGSGIVGIIIR